MTGIKLDLSMKRNSANSDFFLKPYKTGLFVGETGFGKMILHGKNIKIYKFKFIQLHI